VAVRKVKKKGVNVSVDLGGGGEGSRSWGCQTRRFPSKIIHKGKLSIRKTLNPRNRRISQVRNREGKRREREETSPTKLQICDSVVGRKKKSNFFDGLSTLRNAWGGIGCTLIFRRKEKGHQARSPLGVVGLKDLWGGGGVYKAYVSVWNLVGRYLDRFPRLTLLGRGTLGGFDLVCGDKGSLASGGRTFCFGGKSCGVSKSVDVSPDGGCLGTIVS